MFSQTYKLLSLQQKRQKCTKSTILKFYVYFSPPVKTRCVEEVPVCETQVSETPQPSRPQIKFQKTAIRLFHILPITFNFFAGISRLLESQEC